MLQFGMSVAMSTVVNGALMPESSTNSSNRSDINLSHSAASWYGSLLLIFHPLGSLLSSYIQDKFGRKTCLTLVSIPEFLGWLSLYMATTTHALYLSASCLGIGMGLSEAPILTYIGESIEPRIRSGLSSFTNFCSMIGLFTTYALASVYTWKQIALAYLFLPVIVFFMASLVIPESPVWLLSKKKSGKATKALCWLRGFTNANAVTCELSDMHEFIHRKTTAGETTNETKKQKTFFGKLKSIVDILLEEDILRPFVMFNIVFIFCTISAMLPAKPFLVFIMISVGQPFTEPKKALVVIGFMTLIGSFFNMCTVRLIGKRKLLITCTLISVTCQCIIGLHAMGAIKLISISSVLPFILLCTISFVSGYGITPIPWIMLGEIFPMKGRGIVSGITAALNSIFAFCLTNTYWDVIDLISLPQTLILHGLIGAAGIPYIYCMLPETENKTLRQIQNDFETRKSANKRSKI